MLKYPTPLFVSFSLGSFQEYESLDFFCSFLSLANYAFWCTHKKMLLFLGTCSLCQIKMTFLFCLFRRESSHYGHFQTWRQFELLSATTEIVLRKSESLRLTDGYALN